MHRGGRGDARASCASPLSTPLTAGSVQSIGTVPRRLFLLHNRESNIKKFAVPRGENISKKKGEKSCNFREIIEKLYFIV